MFDLCNPHMTGLLQGEYPQIWAQSDPPPIDLSVGDIRSQIAAEWLQIAQWSQWRAYRKPPSLFLMVPSLTKNDLPFPQNGGSICPQYTRMTIISATGDRSTSCLVLGWGFRGRRIERRDLRFEQVQDGGRRHVGKISNGHISATGRPIHFMFCSRVGFLGTADLIALFPVRTNSRWRPPPSWIILNRLISTTAHDLLRLYSAHRGVIFAIAQLSCIYIRFIRKLQKYNKSNKTRLI